MFSIHPSAVRRRGVPLLLLLAALTYVSGASAEPWLHRHSAEAVQTDGGRDGSVPGAPLHDAGCAVCTALGAPALPVAGQAAPLLLDPAVDPLPRLPATLRSSTLPLRYARGPPLA